MNQTRSFMIFIQMILLVGARGMLAAVAPPPVAKPNIVWIFSDDHAWQAIGAYGGRLRDLNPTPTIDRLARDGMRFDHCCVENSICTPSRAALLTGKFSHKHGARRIGGHGFDWTQTMFPQLLRDAGYQTALVGKLHIEGKPTGFDHWEVLPGQGVYDNPVFLTPTGTVKYAGYASDVITDRALEWLKTDRAKNQPFLLMIHHKAPHRPFTPAERHMPLYEKIEIPEPANLFDDYATRGVAAHQQDMSIEKTMRMGGDLKAEGGADKRFAARRQYFEENRDKLAGRELTQWKYQTFLKDYLRCVKAVDENVDRVLDYLEADGLAKNTVVMYSSDQGFYLGEHGWFDKRFMYTESFRTPLIVRWPGVVQPGAINTDLVQNIDWAPTFLDMAGVTVPTEMQGRSLVPLLKGSAPADWRHSLYYRYYEYPGTHNVRQHEGVATKQHKLIRFFGPDVPNGEEWEFYDLVNDPSEMNNVYANPAYAPMVADLKTELNRLRKQYEVPEDKPQANRPRVNPHAKGK